ncbi:MAG: hypothetical protein IT169_04245 [Bryobacterales bacterium]|nr:hypothetical protein [Bryobacterales bacterium]
MATAVQWEMGAEDNLGNARNNGTRNTWRERTEAYKLRSIPNEDVYFYSKRINNSRLVKPEDPVSRRKAVGLMAGGIGFAAMLILLMMPHLMNLMAGMQIHALEEERRALVTDHDAIELEESRLMDPKRMNAIARENNLVEPGPQQVFYLNPLAKPRSKEVLEAKLK